MKLLLVTATLLFIVLRSQAYDNSSSPKVVIDVFFAAMKAGDADLAISLVYQPPGSEQRIQSRVRSLAQRSKVTGRSPEYIESRERVSIAIAIVRDVAKSPDGKTDYDAVLLLNRDSKWLIVLGIAEVEDQIGILTKEEREQLIQLRKWQDVRMLEIASQSEQSK